MHIGDLTGNPLLVTAGMVVLAAAALLAAVVVAGRMWNGGDAEPLEPLEPLEPPARPGGIARAVRPEEALRRESQRLTEYASAAAERAARADVEAAAAREHSVAAEEKRDAAWDEYETASLPLIEPGGDGGASGRTPDPGAVTGAGDPPVDGEAVTHAAFVAFRNGAISVRELQRVWSGTASADPVQERRERDAARRIARQRDARRAYESASGAARVALEQARIAEVAATALASEAAEAAEEASTAQASVERYRRLLG